jgi:hypothetical protein
VRGNPVDARSDLFSLGAVFYEMLTRQAPFAGNSAQEIRQSILRADPLPPSELNPLVPGALDRMVLSLLTLRPDGRPADARIVLRDLHRVEEGLGLRASVEVAAAKAAAHAQPARADRVPIHPAPPPRIPRPDPFSEAGDFGGFRPGAADADVVPEHPLTADHEDFDHRKAMMERGSRRKPPSGSRAGMLTALGLMLAAVGVGFGAYMYFLSGSLAPTPAAPLATAPAPVAGASKEPVAAFGEWKSTRPVAVADTPVEQKPPPAVDTPRPIAPPPLAEAIKTPAPAPVVAKEPQKPQAPGTLFGLKPTPSNPLGDLEPLPHAKTPVARAPEKPAPVAAAPVAAAPAKQPPRAAPPAPKVAKQQPRRMAHLTLAVSPAGELYINGEHQGTTPPVTTFELEPGMHRIEIRNGSRRPYVTYMTVEAGEERRIRHDFNARPSPPPG